MTSENSASMRMPRWKSPVGGRINSMHMLSASVCITSWLTGISHRKPVSCIVSKMLASSPLPASVPCVLPGIHASRQTSKKARKQPMLMAR